MRRKGGGGREKGKEETRRDQKRGRGIVSIKHPGISDSFEIKTIKLPTPI